MSTLHLIRHGQASFGAGDYDRLSLLGHRQAGLTGDFLAASGQPLAVAFCGEMLRQRQSAQDALAAWPEPTELVVLPQFNEYPFEQMVEIFAPVLAAESPEWAQAAQELEQDPHQYMRVFREALARWLAGETPSPKLESSDAFAARVAEGLALAATRLGRGTIGAVFTSGGPIAMLVARSLGLDKPAMMALNLVMRNSSITSFICGQGRHTLLSFNSAAHLEQQREPDLVTQR